MRILSVNKKSIVQQTYGKRGMLRLNYEVAGKLALAGALSKESSKEQASAGLSAMSKKKA
ncbi:hypothetical protein KUTeg_024495 [Tegillarca granosa]|uniref:Uncharacterized protein n=1 Tax=Tegillarca granosa TaxID=220873 RepID=A0ABQ9DXG1_TEGGR|nr:hypothetical protein KUTeg_024495 [Tegillarca granosa]